MGCRLCGHTESDTTEATQQQSEGQNKKVALVESVWEDGD